MNNELKQIKKIYGEEMMHMCRELFPSILEQEGLLLEILTEHLAPTHSFASDVKENCLEEEFKNWIYSLVNKDEDELPNIDKTPFELMKEAGYTLCECKSEADIQTFKKYYQQGEELCTFWGGRLERCHVFFAVKDNVDEIKREKFSSPQREDEYGTSVISIQFSRGNNNTLSIKNRYNHTVMNPDATFSNNLENIIPGLTKSFEKYYKFNINQQQRLKETFMITYLCYVRGNENRYYRYNLEVGGIYFCENNIVVIDGNVKREYAKEKERYILIDNYIIDLKEKTIKEARKLQDDAFTRSITRVGKIEKIEIVKNEKNKIVLFKYTDGKTVSIDINQHNAIIGCENEYIEEVEDDFLRYNVELSHLYLPKVEEIGNYFLGDNEYLTKISLPQVKIIGNSFLKTHDNALSIDMPNVEKIGNHFLRTNKRITEISLPKVKAVGDSFLNSCVWIQSVNLPELKTIGENFIQYSKKIKELSLPEVETVSDDFLYFNNSIEKIYLPKLKKTGSSFLRSCYKIKSVDFPELQFVGACFMIDNQYLNHISAPKLLGVGDNFLCRNCCIKEISLPRIQDIGDNFLLCNETLKKIDIPVSCSYTSIQGFHIIKLLESNILEKHTKK